MRRKTKDSGLTAGRLREVLAYDRKRGAFRWRCRMTPRGIDHTGQIAGCLSRNGYILIRIDGCLYLAHLLAFLYVKGRWPEREVDHRDTIGHHNWWTNLREASSSQNKMNASLRADNVAGLKGVSKRTDRCYSSPYRARIQVNGRQLQIGSFATPEEAHRAYLAKAKELFGDFMRAA